MLLYRPILLNKGPRMLIAVLLAIALHLGFMNIEFSSRPVFVPHVSLPRSVSIMLEQKSRKSVPDQAAAKQNSNLSNDTSPVEKKTLSAVTQKIPAEPETVLKSTQPESAVNKQKVQRQPAVNEKKNADLFDDTSVPPQETRQNRPAEVQPAMEYSDDTTEEAAVSTEAQTADAENLSPKPGALQMAYPRYQLNAPPTYPNLARKRGRQGTVVLQVLVNGQGRVDEIRLDESSGYSMLDRAAFIAVKKWIFEPGRRGNETVSMWVRVPVTFRLKN